MEKNKTITQDQFEKMVKACRESDKIRKIYDEYIVKEISFEEWNRSVVEHLLLEGGYSIVV